ncbi:MAG: alanine racemase, partial [Propionibacterium sp.]
ILLAVKADAYGHGLVPIATMAQKCGCVDWLGVATVPEGQELRTAGIELPILKLSHCFPEELPAAIAANLTLTVVDEDTIQAAEKAGAIAGQIIDVHLKLDSGMGRIGARLTEAVTLTKMIDDCPHLNLDGVFTHLPVSDSPAGAEFTNIQINEFSTAVEAIKAARGPINFVHLANSGAILSHDLGISNMVRAGIMAYGYYPDAETPKTVPLRQVIQLVSRISFIKYVLAGESVGYGRTWVAEKPTRIATIPIGYGDGYSRLLSNCGRALVGGKSCPIRGRVCMDQIMVEVDDSVAVGDQAVLIGAQGAQFISTDEIAELTNTINYEVTCQIGPRVRREYRN